MNNWTQVEWDIAEARKIMKRRSAKLRLAVQAVLHRAAVSQH